MIIEKIQEIKIIYLFLAPSQPPSKVMWNTSNSKIILNWEQVKPLENESEVMGYKVSCVMAFLNDKELLLLLVMF